MLDRLRRSQRHEINHLLCEEIAGVKALLNTGAKTKFVQAKDLHVSYDPHDSKWSETFYEIHDAAGEILTATANVPFAGLGPGTQPVEVENGIAFWERIHPQSRRGHRKIRIAETGHDGYRIRRSCSGSGRSHPDRLPCSTMGGSSRRLRSP